MDTIETINYRGYEITTHYDQDAESPDQWGNTDLFLVYDHRQFNVERKGFEPQGIYEHLQAGNKTYDNYYVFPLYAYIHSGVSLSVNNNSYPFTDRWDTSMSGFILVKRQKEWWTHKQAYKAAEALVSEWNEYLHGEIYGYNSEAGGGWGFYGDEGYKYMLSEARAEIDQAIQVKQKDHFAQLKTWIKNHVPLSKRTALLV